MAKTMIKTAVKLRLRGKVVSVDHRRLVMLLPVRKRHWVLSHRVNRDIAEMSWFRKVLNVTEMAMAIARAVQFSGMSYVQIERTAKRHFSFLCMMQKGHLHVDTKMRIFWDYIGDLYGEQDVAEFVFMQKEHNTVSEEALRLALAFVCTMRTSSGLSVEDFTHCFFRFEECTVRLEAIDSASFNDKSYDIYEVFESMLPFTNRKKRQETSIGLWEVLCNYVPLL